MLYYEVFDPVTGETVGLTRYRWLAELVTEISVRFSIFDPLDYLPALYEPGDLNEEDTVHR